VAQDALLLAFKALPQLEDHDKFGSWLYAITRHRAFRFAQNPARREETGVSEVDALILEHTPELAQHPAEAVERAESQRDVREAMAQLPEEFQIVLQLRYFDEVPVLRMAEFLNLPLTTVKWRLHKGRQLMKKHLEHRWSEKPEPQRRRRHERRARQNQTRDAAAGADAGGHQQNGARGKPDGATVGRQSRGDSPIQRDFNAHRGTGRHVQRPVRAVV
jgi:RNA polymerase sigma-70 factor (ECF subfamily)